LQHCGINVLDSPAWRDEQLLVPQSEPPFIQLVHDRDMGRLNSLFFSNLHFPAQSPEPFWQSHIKRHRATSHYVPLRIQRKEDIVLSEPSQIVCYEKSTSDDDTFRARVSAARKSAGGSSCPRGIAKPSAKRHR